MHHTMCAGGLALLFSHGNCEQDTWFGDELIGGHGAEGLAAPPYGQPRRHPGSSHWLQWMLVLIPGRFTYFFPL